MRKIAHVINPIRAEPGSRLAFVQQVSFQSMQTARAFAAEQVEIKLVSAQYPEDHPMIPEGFQVTPDLERSVLDIKSFREPRKLPLLQDVLGRLSQTSNADYFIYTNVDIGLLPHFYTAVDRFIEAGYDAFTITRRTIADHYNSLDQLPLMYTDLGEPHRGWDCFVFQRDAYHHYTLGEVCIGIPRADLVLLGNLICFSKNFREFRDLHLTFHLGNDRSWWKRTWMDYNEHNSEEAKRILRQLGKSNKPFNPQSPPGMFLFFTQNKILEILYETALSRVHIPARFGRPLRGLVSLLKWQKNS